MDTVKFIEERNRMCGTMSEVWGVDAAKIVKNTEEWSAARPRKTRQDVFLEQHPETVLDSYGVPQFCPTSISAAHRDSNGACKNPERRCRDCRKEFWSKEIE